VRIGFVGPSYTAGSTAVADEECINFFAESVESQGAIVPTNSYGGKNAVGIRAYFGTPGLSVFSAFTAGPVRGQCWTGTRLFVVSGDVLYEVFANGSNAELGVVGTDGKPASLVASAIQVLIVSAGRAFCLTLGTNAIVEVTSNFSGRVPVKVEYSDSYFIVMFANSNIFQMSQVLDGTVWPGLLVNEVEVFSENISSIICNHREPWILGTMHSQPYQDTGSAEVFDVIPGTLIEKGCAATFIPCRLDNSVFWIDQDERGALSAWRSSGYTPVRISTHAVEYDLGTNSAANIAGMVSYAYEERGHIFWMIYVPGSSWSWCYDVVEALWHKRASWNATTGTWGPHFSWNHAYAWGMHLVGDWNSGNLYLMSMANLQDAVGTIQRLRRTPTVSDEMKWIPHDDLTVDFDTGQGPQPPLVDGNGDPRPPQAMLRWSDNRGKTWSNQHIVGCGMAGEYNTRAIWRRLGRSRYRVYELTVSDPVVWVIVDAYLRTGGPPA